MALAVKQIANGGFANAGQNCISVQRIIVHQNIYETFMDQFVPAVEAMKVGDPRQADTDIGPMIRMRDADRAWTWLNEAKDGGAQVITGGTRNGTLFNPTVLTKTTPEMNVSCQEVFAPIVTVVPYREWDDAIAIINDSEFGLQAGIFTNDMHRIMQAWDEIEVGGLQVNDVSTFRVDHMPYGGVKASGFGREGVKYTIQEMTEPRLMVLNLNQ
jgi:acyl-CoA reductase-like NAD-dependent aldehyde dehydrogenase